MHIFDFYVNLEVELQLIYVLNIIMFLKHSEIVPLQIKSQHVRTLGTFYPLFKVERHKYFTIEKSLIRYKSEIILPNELGIQT